MLRPRNTLRWEKVTQYENIKGFLESPAQDGVHTVWLGDHSLDLLIEDRGSPLTLVFFHGAATSRALTYPILQGGGVAERSGANLVAVADPTLQMGDVDLAWYLGNSKTGPLRNLLTPLIRHAVASLPGSRTLLVGASGGGYAAINFAAEFPESLVLAINPRLHLNRRPFPGPRMVEYLKAAYGKRTNQGLRQARREHVTDDIAELLPDKLNFDLMLFQNLGDRWYLTRQTEPFIERYRSDPRLYVRFDDYGRGHTPIPRATLDSIMGALVSETRTQKAIRVAGFSTASDVVFSANKLSDANA